MPTLTCEPILFHDFLPAANGRKIHGLDTDQVKAALVTTVPSMQSATVLADVTQVVSGNGYTTDGVVCTVVPPTHTGGIYRLVITNIPGWTGSGSGFSHIGVVFFNNTATSKNLIAAAFQSTAGQLAVTNVAQSGTTATITALGHGFSAGDTVVHDRIPFARLNGTFTVSTPTTNTYQITAPVSATITSQAVTSGKVIRPEQVTTASGAPYTITANPTTGILAVAPTGVTV